MSGSLRRAGVVLGTAASLSAALAATTPAAAPADTGTTVTHSYPCTDSGTRSSGLTYRAEITQTLTVPSSVPRDGSFTVGDEISTVALDATGGGSVTTAGGSALAASTGSADVGYDVAADSVQVATTVLAVPAQQVATGTAPAPVTIRAITGAESAPVPGDAVPGAGAVALRLPPVVRLSLQLLAPDGSAHEVDVSCNDRTLLLGGPVAVVPVTPATGTKDVVRAASAAGATPAPASGAPAAPGSDPSAATAPSPVVRAAGTVPPGGGGRGGVLGTGVPAAISYPVLGAALASGALAVGRRRRRRT